ncbi:Uncharacterised protein [Burkholderia pseudomallei]|nr:Uncharacterised protein [Burkholderia pseudomallei]
MRGNCRARPDARGASGASERGARRGVERGRCGGRSVPRGGERRSNAPAAPIRRADRIERRWPSPVRCAGSCERRVGAAPGRGNVARTGMRVWCCARGVEFACRRTRMRSRRRFHHPLDEGWRGAVAMAMAFVLAIVVTFLVAHLRPTSGPTSGLPQAYLTAYLTALDDRSNRAMMRAMLASPGAAVCRRSLWLRCRSYFARGLPGGGNAVLEAAGIPKRAFCLTRRQGKRPATCRSKPISTAISATVSRIAMCGSPLRQAPSA